MFIESTLSNPTASSVSSKPKNSNNLTSDFETFLKMLTVQARYQNPLEPIDSGEYAAQLAQFSAVEQQVKTNEILASFAKDRTIEGLSAMSDWVGLEVRAPAPAIYNGSPVVIFHDQLTPNSNSILVVTDEYGTEVDRLLLPSSAGPVAWNGMSNGSDLTFGSVYNFAIEQYEQGELVSTVPAELYSHVEEVRIDNEEIALVLSGGTSISATSVSAVRQTK